MRILAPEIFETVKANDNRALDLAWQRPLIFIEVPGTTSYDIHLHWHRRCMRDNNYVGFLDLLLNARGVNDTAWGPMDITPDQLITCHLPFMQGTSVAYGKTDCVALEAFKKRIEFGRSLFVANKSASIRYYTEPSPAGFEEVDEVVNQYLIPHGRLVFVEKKFDPLFNLVRMIRSNQGNDDSDYDITQEQIDWYIASMKKYHEMKARYRKRAAVMMVEDYNKNETVLEWPDNIKVPIKLKVDQISKGFGFRMPVYKSPRNFKEIDEYFRAAWR